MKKLKMNSGEIINIKSVEISGRTNDGFDIWYFDGDTGEGHHNHMFEKDLHEAKELIQKVRKFEELCGNDFIHFTFSKEV